MFSHTNSNFQTAIGRRRHRVVCDRARARVCQMATAATASHKRTNTCGATNALSLRRRAMMIRYDLVIQRIHECAAGATACMARVLLRRHILCRNAIKLGEWNDIRKCLLRKMIATCFEAAVGVVRESEGSWRQLTTRWWQQRNYCIKTQNATVTVSSMESDI